ncbi:MAG: hypothetical protein IPP25_00060 [Saprospiraceae bacterium]|nr:hypothetical protein [Candidatus Opimibacter skivensis]
MVIKIFTYETKTDFAKLRQYGKSQGNWIIDPIMGSYFPAKALQLLGKDITQDILGDVEFGETAPDNKNKIEFISESRLKELTKVQSKEFDLSRLIRLCEEINDNFNRQNYFSVGAIGRTILNHIPPIFGCNNFDQVASNVGSKSMKASLNHLNTSLNNIADSFLHEQIRKRETLPNGTQVDFRQDLDRLLEAIVGHLK